MRKIRELVDLSSPDPQEKSYFELRYDEVGKEVQTKKKRENTRDRYYVLTGSFCVTTNEVDPTLPASATYWDLEANPGYAESWEDAHFLARRFIETLVRGNVTGLANRVSTQKLWEDQLQSHGYLHAMIKTEKATWNHFVVICVLPDDGDDEDDDSEPD
jgi:hypothetical protein